MTVQKAQVFPLQNSTCQHTQVLNALAGPAASCDLCKAIRRGQGFRADPKVTCKWNRKLFQQMTASPSFPKREVFILKRVEEHIHPPHPLLLLQKESFIGKDFFNILKHTKERYFLLHIFEINIIKWQINQYNKLENQLHWEKSMPPAGLTAVPSKP